MKFSEEQIKTAIEMDVGLAKIVEMAAHHEEGTPIHTICEYLVGQVVGEPAPVQESFGSTDEPSRPSRRK